MKWSNFQPDESSAYPAETETKDFNEKRRAARVEKTRTISEPSVHEVEMLCSHFASPSLAQCCRSMPDLEKVHSLANENAPTVPPIKLMKSPSNEICLAEGMCDSTGTFTNRFRSSGNFSSRENSCRDRNFFADNSCNNTVIHVSSRGVLSHRRKSSFALPQASSDQLREVSSESNNRTWDSSLLVTNKIEVCQAKSECLYFSQFFPFFRNFRISTAEPALPESWALEDRFQTTLCATVETQNNAEERSRSWMFADDQPLSPSFGEGDFEIRSKVDNILSTKG